MFHLRGHGLLMVDQVFFELIQDVFVFDHIDESGCGSLVACTTCPSCSVNVVYELVWGMIVDHMCYVVYVNTSGCN